MHILVFLAGFCFGIGFASLMIAFIMGANKPIPVNVHRQVSYGKCDVQEAMEDITGPPVPDGIYNGVTGVYTAPKGTSGMHPIMTKPRDTFTPSVDKFKS